ncbi:SKP1 [Quillaja saponaria]|uniref:SKP1-like protein n=1 Tax=Quillaja saponaria TaxID=32244 RepID=A0AAD7L044_QUISA|nr:SKP1 [Quillaja saponaria]
MEDSANTTSETQSVITSESSSEPNSKPVSKKIKLKTADLDIFEVDEEIAMEFQTVKSYIEDGVPEGTVTPLPNVSSAALAKSIEYCRKHLEFNGKSKVLDDSEGETDAKPSEEAKAFEAKFLDEAVADRIKNKSVEYVRKFFGFENDFTPEEEAKLREDYAWAFEGVDED